MKNLKGILQFNTKLLKEISILLVLTSIFSLSMFQNIIYAQEDLENIDMIYRKVFVELPLYRGDYYYGKHINASVAANEINNIPILKPGQRVRIIKDGYLTFDSKSGYIQPPGEFIYASGVCWTVSSLGAVMDEVNKRFEKDYGIPLFIFEYADRIAHRDAYKTYTYSNYGYGYTVVKRPDWITDYSFTVNPELENFPQFKNLKVKIVMVSSTDNNVGFKGESIGGYILTNVDF